MAAGERINNIMGLFNFFKKKKRVTTNSSSIKTSEESELFELANNCVFRLSNEFKTLNPIGEAEALIFFSTIVVSLPKLCNYVILDLMEERFMILLCNAIKTKFDVEDFYEFANDRVEFYETQYDKVKHEKLYTPMFIYNAIYMNPGCENPGYLKEFKEHPTTLLMLQAKLYEIEDYISFKREQIYNRYHLR